MAMSNRLTAGACAALILAGAAPGTGHDHQDHGDRPVPGYTDTPLIPGTRWHVHDPHRPQPAIIGQTAALATPPPGDAIVLFNGNSLAAFTGQNGEPAGWALINGTMRTNGTGSISTREAFGDIQLHVEFMAPDPGEGDGQMRGNSGLFFMGRYELQVLDSANNPVYPDGQAGALYGQSPPLVNASAPPRAWQSYDVVFEVPRFAEDGALISPAYITVLHNGVLVQHRTAFQGATSHRALARYSAHEAAAPLAIQDHGQQVAFRNIWVRKLDLPPSQMVPQLAAQLSK